MNPDPSALPSLNAVFDGARQFGLTDREVLETVDESLFVAGVDASVAEFLDGLSGALARHILSTERCPAKGRGTVYEELFEDERRVKRVGPGW